jgi:hypothetical protein
VEILRVSEKDSVLTTLSGFVGSARTFSAVPACDCCVDNVTCVGGSAVDPEPGDSSEIPGDDCETEAAVPMPCEPSVEPAASPSDGMAEAYAFC